LILLDENTLASQRARLAAARHGVRKVGVDWGRSGMSDEQILVELRGMRRVTFVTRDAGLYRQDHCHPNYCLVVASIRPEELAAYVIRFLRHPAFRTYALRDGKVLRLQPAGIVCWQRGVPRELQFAWS
jgi:uncharacterized protein YbjT (DUF2867 family)